ncbi:MAG: mononuclear molybdenum enzyme YedY, partial [Pseudomonadota bacterium]
MLIRRPDPIKPSEITSESTYLSRRDVVAALTSAALLPTSLRAADLPRSGDLEGIVKSPLSTDEDPNSYEDVTT